MRNLVRLAAVTAITALPCIAMAAHRMPGLWQVTTQARFIKGGIQIPPDVQAMMRQRGMKMPDLTAPHSFKHCLTREDAARDENPAFSKDKACTTQHAAWSGNHFHAEQTCAGEPEGTTHVVIDGTLGIGGTSFSGTAHVEGDNPRMGGHYVMESRYEGKWLGPTCGKDAS
jgi:Protein of unknown function (DUF3617)